MDIFPLGHSSFRIKGKTVTVVTDPYDSALVGFGYPKHVSADIVTVSHAHKDHNQTALVEGNPYSVNGPGEYEIKGVGIIGIPLFHDGEKGATRGMVTAYHMEIDGVNVVHLGDVGSSLTSDDVDRLDGVNILFIPVGGVYTIDPNQAAGIIGELEPSIVIPMHYKTPRHNPKEFGDLSPVSAFLKTMGKEAVVAVPKLSTSKDKLPDEMQVVVLE
ncbi:MAG: Zn-dependent hydrolase of the beta-lactamase fold-like protein [Candidatus Gottesmanbacteria bacterium GW2011_GWA2_44_17]|uniref:Zn-dependent hydrolase of the beta-lactamase fold-like protein n=1 Tax=Candidatus Gottesmanbacteria bacterium GW2011_GWA2_44_17 TaxID=1618444 RepID=A0A0G1KDS7_9BACT|nr:MAG: Zn-dependent hydrolase of the beta-lactamase fold-like protein [Candidatus Gottesmanbacteria bacterium GW2011_GWA2_44_17]HCM82002.1 lactamase [Patescibacteria group bacterium]